MDREGSRFAFLQEKFPRVSMGKLKACMYIWRPSNKGTHEGPNLDEELNKVELSEWQSLQSVVINFLGNPESAQCEKGIEPLLKSFR